MTEIGQIIDKLKNNSNDTNIAMKKIRDHLGKLRDSHIISFHERDGDNMLEPLNQIAEGFRDELVHKDLKRISDLKQNNELSTDQRKQLDEIEKLENRNLKIIKKIQDTIKNIREVRLYKALSNETLQSRALKKIKKHGIEARNPLEQTILNYAEIEHSITGGVRKSHKRKNNTRKSKRKNKTLKSKKNYL
jgi:hypothetical protein